MAAAGVAGMFPAWARDGAIAYTDAGEGSTVSVVRKGKRRMFPAPDFNDPPGQGGPGIASNLRWSPDGGKLAYTLSGIESGTGGISLTA